MKGHLININLHDYMLGYLCGIWFPCSVCRGKGLSLVIREADTLLSSREIVQSLIATADTHCTTHKHIIALRPTLHKGWWSGLHRPTLHKGWWSGLHLHYSL